MLAQYSMKKELDAFEDDGAVAVEIELKQLHIMDRVMLMAPESMTREQRIVALWYLIFLYKKRCGLIKASGCVDGRKYFPYMTNEDTNPYHCGH